MKKEAINTFSEGLIMDLNPLTTPSNVMTSCLNGTIITYNGNEFVLQNDMGNGRVETAYLPAGYVPIGIKEHGGIIYVASYNPLTNKGQIGSFPSPERNISSNEISQTDKIIAQQSFFNNGIFSTTYKLNLFEGSDNLVLRSGDRFSIVISGGTGPDDLKKYISNYLNVENGKIISPKNKALTLKACIIDANSNLRDITPQLKRIDVNGENYSVLEFKESDSQLFKENSGFYALPSKFDTNMPLDEYRKNRALNVYNNKVFGELYIVATLNTIQRIDFSISGSKNGDVANLQLMMTYYYNCPDGFFEQTEKDDRYKELYDRYLTIYGRKKDFAEGKLIKGYKFSIDDENGELQSKDIPFSIKKVENVEYLESENLYKVTNVYNLNSMPIQKDEDGKLLDNDVRHFSVIPSMTYAQLLGLTTSGTINLAKLGSGEINLNTWRYYCTQDVITLTWGFEAYLKSGQIIEDLQFEFYDAETQTNTYTYSPARKYSYNGTFNDILGYQDGLIYQKLYLVIIKCKLNTLDDKNNPEIRTFARWLLTTPLYNKHYFDTQDYFNLTNLNDNTNFTGLNDINLGINYYKEDLSKSPEVFIQQYSPSFSDKQDQIIEGYRTNNIACQIHTTVDCVNANNYPFSINSSRYEIQLEADENNSNIEWNGLIAGSQEVPPSLKLDSTSHSQDDWQNKNTNVLLVNMQSHNRIFIRYKIPSFVLGKKLSTPRTITLNNILSKYTSSDRQAEIFGAEVVSDQNPPFALQLVFREQYREHKHNNERGYGYFPIEFQDLNYRFMRTPATYTAYTIREYTHPTTTYYAKDKWTEFTAEAVKEVLGFNPIVIFMTFNTAQSTGDFGDYFKPSNGYMRSADKPIKSLALWFDGANYGMVDGWSSKFYGTGSLMDLIYSDLRQFYVRQAKPNNTQGYLVDPESSSYVAGGSAVVNVQIKGAFKIKSEQDALPEYLSDITATISNINNTSKANLDKDTIQKLSNLMQFQINETASIDIPIQFQEQVADMSSTFGMVQQLFDNPEISTPVILDDGKIYQTDSNGNAISELKIYAKDGNNMLPINMITNLNKYDKVFNVKEFNGEYHLMPKKVFGTGKPRISAGSVSEEHPTNLSFDAIKMINLKYGEGLSN